MLGPAIGVDIVIIVFGCGDLIAAVLVARFGHDTGIVAPAGQYKGQFGVQIKMHFVDRWPRRDVVLDRADREHRSMDIGH